MCSRRLREAMSENTPSEEQPEPSEEAESAAQAGGILLHLVLVGVVAMLAGVLSAPVSRGRGTSWIDMTDAFLALVWFSFAAYAVIATLGSLERWGNLSALLAMHGLALVLALPGGLLLVFLRVFFLGAF